MSDFVSLTCPSCGGKLQITKDIDRFACGYCGNEHVVKRAGGIISIAPLVEKLTDVQVSLDKTGAELAINRLKEEIPMLQSQRQSLFIELQREVVDPREAQLREAERQFFVIEDVYEQQSKWFKVGLIAFFLITFVLFIFSEVWIAPAIIAGIMGIWLISDWTKLKDIEKKKASQYKLLLMLKEDLPRKSTVDKSHIARQLQEVEAELNRKQKELEQYTGMGKHIEPAPSFTTQTRGAGSDNTFRWKSDEV